MKTNHLDLQRKPYRGILSEIAAEDGVSRQAVSRRMHRGDPDTLLRIAKKKLAIDAKLKESRNVFRE
ncbi:MAG: hypothetical protein ABIR47_04945 [Candidatus Kapaibacterium sp.]